jgi:hypothetical protein
VAAIGYALGNRAALTQYTEVRFLAVDNNASERALRAVAVGRRNYLFAGSDTGARSAAVLYSVVGTRRRLGIDPFAYQRDALVRRPGLPGSRIDDFLPDRWAGAPGSSSSPSARGSLPDRPVQDKPVAAAGGSVPPREG